MRKSKRQFLKRVRAGLNPRTVRGQSQFFTFLPYWIHNGESFVELRSESADIPAPIFLESPEPKPVIHIEIVNRSRERSFLAQLFGQRIVF